MRENSKKRAIFLLIALLTFLALAGMCHYLFKPRSVVYELKNNWNIVYNDKEYSHISISNLRKVLGKNPGKGDKLFMSRTVTPGDDIDFPTLAFLSKYSADEVLINDTIIFSSDMDKLADGRFIGKEYVFLTLEKRNVPFNLEIRHYVNEADAYTDFESPVFGDFHSVTMHIIFTNMFALSAGVFLIIFGMAFLIITMVFYKTLPDILSQLFSSLLFINLGVWILCYFNITDIFINTNGHTSEIEYFSLFLMVPIIYMIAGCMQQHYSDWIFVMLASTSTIICMFLVVLHMTGIAFVNQTLLYYHFIAIICILFLAATITKDIIRKKLHPSEIILLTGMAFLLLSFMLTLLSYMLEITGATPMHYVSKHLIPLGGLIFIFSTLINYFIYLSESFARRKEYESLTHLAYADGLTNLPNRSRYEKYMADLDKSKDDYCIISMDLNGLKQINDNDGHAKGDKYLQEFAVTLQQCFDNKGFLARIGGDEFIAIMTKEHWPEIESILARLRDSLEVKNVLYPEFRRSVATGYAYNTEVQNANSHSVYLLADKRMYENKKKMHEKLGIAARI